MAPAQRLQAGRELLAQVDPHRGEGRGVVDRARREHRRLGPVEEYRLDGASTAIVALGSSPSFDPNIFAKIIRQRDFTRLSSEENGKPLFNRATQAGYPTGSTFKLVTAVAALEGGLITPDTPLFDGGSLTDPDLQRLVDAGEARGTLKRLCVTHEDAPGGGRRRVIIAQFSRPSETLPPGLYRS